MKFKTVLDLKLFFAEIGRIDLLEATDDAINIKEYILADDLAEDYVRRRQRVSKYKDFKKSSQQKSNWRKNRAKIMKGIKKFHKSTDGKRLHRNMGRFLATRDMRHDDYVEALKAVSSMKTHAYIEYGYYMQLDDALAFDDFMENAIPKLTSLEGRLFNRSDDITDEEIDICVRIVESAQIIKSFAEKSGKTELEVEKLWDKAKDIVAKQYDINKDDSKFYGLVVGVLKKSLKI